MKLADKPHGARLDVALSGDARTTESRGIAYVSTDCAVAQSEGMHSFAISDGDNADSCVIGNFHSVALSIGYESKAATMACRGSAAIALGVNGAAKADDGCAIVLAYHAPRGGLVHVKAGIAGKKGIKPNTWYRLSRLGEFEEVK